MGWEWNVSLSLGGKFKYRRPLADNDVYVYVTAVAVDPNCKYDLRRKRKSPKRQSITHVYISVNCNSNDEYFRRERKSITSFDNYSKAHIYCHAERRSCNKPIQDDLNNNKLHRYIENETIYNIYMRKNILLYTLLHVHKSIRYNNARVYTIIIKHREKRTDEKINVWKNLIKTIYRNPSTPYYIFIYIRKKGNWLTL